MKRFVIKWRDRATLVIKKAVVTVDDGDARWLRNKIYRVHNNCVNRAPDGFPGEIQLAQDIMGHAGKGYCWSHKDGDPLNCTRENLVRRSISEHMKLRPRKMAA